MAFTNIISGTIGGTAGSVIYTNFNSKSIFQVRYDGTGNWLECSENANITGKSNCSFELKLKDGATLTTMQDMFWNCSSLTSLDLSNLDTSSVTNMQSVFNNCSSLTSLNVSNFNTSQVTTMNSMFFNCSSLTSLDLSSFNTSNVKYNGDPYSANVENYIESRKAFTNPYYISGKFVKYKRVGNTLYVNKGLDTVNLLYHANILDKDGLPDINDKEASAIAVYIAFTIKQKEAFKTHNQVIMQEAQYLRKRWLGLLDAARVPNYISQNEMNDILDAKYSWDRKVYNKSYKPM